MVHWSCRSCRCSRFRSPPASAKKSQVIGVADAGIASADPTAATAPSELNHFNFVRYYIPLGLVHCLSPRGFSNNDAK